MDTFSSLFCAGVAWFIMGIFHYLQSNNSRFLRSLRTKPFWLYFRSIFLMIFCVFGIVIELLRAEEGRDSQKYVILWTGLFSSGFFEFCHMHNMIPESFWSCVSPVAFSFTIVLQTVDSPPVSLEILTYFSSFLVIPIMIISLKIATQRHHQYAKLKSKQKITHGGGRGAKERRDLEENINMNIHPVYLETPFEGLMQGILSWILTLQGVISWEMAFRWRANEALGITKLVGEDGLPLRFDSAHEAHGILAQVIADVFISVCILGFFAASCKVIEKRKYASGESLDSTQAKKQQAHTQEQ